MSFYVSVNMTIAITDPEFKGFDDDIVMIAMEQSGLDHYAFGDSDSTGVEVNNNQVLFFDDCMSEMSLRHLFDFAVALSKSYPQYTLEMDKTNNEASSMEEAGNVKYRIRSGYVLKLFSSIMTVTYAGHSIESHQIVEASTIVLAENQIIRQMNEIQHFHGGNVDLGTWIYTSHDDNFTVEFSSLKEIREAQDLVDVKPQSV